MEQIGLNSKAEYQTAIYTTDPLKIGFILNKVIHNPETSILVETGKNEYWVFYTGNASLPEKDTRIKNFKMQNKESKNIKLEDDSVLGPDRWVSEIVKIQRGDFFFVDICNAINKIRNKNTIRIVVEQGEEVNRKLYFYYKT
ncbi:hypothetical protein [Flavobacterium chilense]|nr:hypothetical protein [Flavobacterium chilense]